MTMKVVTDLRYGKHGEQQQPADCPTLVLQRLCPGTKLGASV